MPGRGRRLSESRTPHDPTQVSPEWHGWLHYTHDKPGNVLVRCPPLPMWCRASARPVRPSPTRHPRPIVGPETRRCSSSLPSTRACSGPNSAASPNSISRRARWPRGSCVARSGPSTSRGAAPSRPLTPRCATVSVQTPPRGSSLPPPPGTLCPALTPRARPRPSRRLRQRENASHPVERPASVYRGAEETTSTKER